MFAKREKYEGFCKFVKFWHGTMQDSLLALSTTFQRGFKIRICNLVGCQETDFLTANEIANSYFEILHRSMQKFNKFTKVFNISYLTDTKLRFYHMIESYTFPFDILGSNVSVCGCSIISGKLKKNLLFQVKYPTSYSRNRICQTL